ncbi:hypothetical protein AciM339_0809 [Aciduliprofundum sp. MAR08-339]|uniref:hypothetical protein n=1 Tax=Aciduliprofundum sp. (strain MAR08-339) TaxID=673860 RepID=UPI0002A4AA5D|nr:hypothetical protein AciM339_0809 [Aciduliprofundum sp. MAR08-339]
MCITEHYNIHNIIKFQINKEKKDFFWDLNPEYEYFKVDYVEKPDIIVNVGDFKPSIEDTYIVDGKYYIKWNYLFLRDDKYDVEINGLEMKGPIILNIKPKPKGLRRLWPILATQNIFLRPLIWLLFIKKGKILIHGGGVGFNNKGILLAGRAGVYKTTITMVLVKKGFGFLGDENIILGENEILPYPFNIRSYEFKLHYLGREEVNGINKIRLFKYLSRDEKLYNLNIFNNGCKLEMGYIIERSLKQNKKLIIDNISREDFLKKLEISEKIEMNISPTHTFSEVPCHNFGKLLDAYIYANPNTALKDIWSRVINIMRQNIKTKEIYKIILPLKYEKFIGDLIYDHIKKVIDL